MSPHSRFAMVLVAAIVTVRCSGSPTAATATPAPTPTPTPVSAPASVSIASITLSTATVVGGDAASGSVVLTGAAPTGGALVTLSAGDPLTVPASVTVPAGANEAAFAVATRVVGVSTSGTVNGTYGGASASMSLAVTRAEAVANFGVTGATESETCSLTNGGATLNCTFNGSTSTAPGTIVSWDWTYGVAGSFSQTTSSATLTMPTVNCSLIPAPPMPAGNPWFTMAITLVVHDNLGNTSAPFVNNDVRLFPAGTCGF